MGPARPCRARRVRYRAAVPGLARAAVCDRQLPWTAGERKLRARALRRARRGQAWADPDSFRLGILRAETGWPDPASRPREGATMETSMLSPDRVCDLEPLSHAAADYDIVRRAIAFVSEHWRAQPESDVIAAAAGVSGSDLHHLFRRWAGITPKAFLQALTLEHAR